MEDNKIVSRRRFGAMELLGMCGFAFFFGWMLASFYWLFAEFPVEVPLAERDGIQLFIFAGIALGYLALHLAGKSPRFDLFKPAVIACELVLALLVPLSALLLHFDLFPPTPLLCFINLCSGAAGGALTVSWLDVASRIRVQSHTRFMSVSFMAGGALFALVALMPELLQPVFCVLYALASVGLLVFSTTRADNESAAPPTGACKNTWTFTKEIEPSLTAFGIVFGLTFVYLFNSGGDAVLIGLLFVIPGAGIIAAFAFADRRLGITAIQRVLLCICVLACLLIPFASDVIQIACSCLVVAAWAAFVSVNYTLIVEKSMAKWDTPVFRQVPARLLFSALGFLVGWGIAFAVTVIYGAHSSAFMSVRLIMAFVLVAVVMLFFPSAEHHNDAGASSQPKDPSTPSASGAVLSDKELFERRCLAVAELYQLSPRETDILKFLAKGRNAAYIQSKLTISPHTVKSHIYSIYRKLDIHSQQKLMDFIEEYPVEE